MNNSKSILGEGNTPLIKSRYIADKFGLKNLWFKNEGLNPSGSFKDRESSYVFDEIMEKGMTNVSIASSGNAAISACVYGKYFDIGVHCIVSEHAAKEKLRLIELLGGKLRVISGYYKESYEWLISSPIEDALNITSGRYAGRELGNIGIVTEIYNEGIVPDLIIVPVGNGSLLYGIFKGLEYLKAKNKIFCFPEVIGVEVEGFAPVAEAIRQKRDFVEIRERPCSIADAGIAAQRAYCSKQCIGAIKATNGYMVEIAEQSILPAHHDLLQEGIYVEYSSACVVSALERLSCKKSMVNKNIVAILTGSGYKCLRM